MLDENAFGLLISYFWIENDEYALERDAFVERFERFRNLVLATTLEHPIGSDVIGTDLGHALYFEIADGEQAEDPIAWLNRQRARLAEADIATLQVLSHGSRWVSDDDAHVLQSIEQGAIRLMRVGGPSEPFRRALDADAAARLEDGDDVVGWGPGLYVEVDAIDALGKKFKNTPTALRAGTGTYYRLGR